MKNSTNSLLCTAKGSEPRPTRFRSSIDVIPPVTVHETLHATLHERRLLNLNKFAGESSFCVLCRGTALSDGVHRFPMFIEVYWPSTTITTVIPLDENKMASQGKKDIDPIYPAILINFTFLDDEEAYSARTARI